MNKRNLAITALSFVVFWVVLFLFAQRYMGDIEDIPLALDPGRGADALHAALPEMAHMARTRHLQTFNLTPALSNDYAFYQRAVEFLYPVRISPNSRFVFAGHGEPLTESCTLSQRGAHIALHDCQP